MTQPPNVDLPGHLARVLSSSGPVSFFHPTTKYLALPANNKRHVHHHVHDHVHDHIHDHVYGHHGVGNVDEGAVKEGQPPKTVPGAYHVWRSRDNRKGRHALLVSRHALGGKADVAKVEENVSDEKAAALARPPRASNSTSEIVRGIVKMCVRYPIWDISYDVAMLFTIGSVIWVINSFFVWLPVQDPGTEFKNEEGTGGGITAIVGATVFEVGAVLGLLEAVNESRVDCFGWAIEEVFEGSSSNLSLLRPRPRPCRHHQAERRRFLKSKAAASVNSVESGLGEQGQSGDGLADDVPSDSATPKTTSSNSLMGPVNPQTAGRANRTWSWCPSWAELRSHYIHEIGFWSCLIQLFGATIFWISGITGIPPILNHVSVPTENGVYWVPQVVGGVGFIVSSFMFMLETQTAWCRPALGILGWHIGFWNLVGAFGFTLCGAFGFAAGHSHNMEYAATLSTFIGSWAFLIGSVIQWYESLDKYPISIKDSIPGEKEC